MSIVYKKLFHILLDRGMKDSEFAKKAGIAASTMTKLRQGKTVQTDIIDKICKALDCQPGDIMERIPDDDDIIDFG